MTGLLFAAAAVGQTPAYNILYSFPYTAFTTTNGGYYPNGTMPNGPLLQASDGNFYGTTMLGGDDGQCSKPPTPGKPVPPCAGTVFQLTPAGKLTVLHVFSWEAVTTPYADGSTPRGGLVEGPDGYLYGSTNFGGVNAGQQTDSGNGIIFRISKTGTFQNLHAFCGPTCTEGRFPSALVLGLDGKFYGTTAGNIFRISASGVLEILHTFSDIPDGSNALTGLIQGSDCNFYGNTLGGGPTPNSAGTVFRITPGGNYTVLYSFSSAAGAPLLNGHSPRVGLVQASNGKLYGATTRGGVYGWGSVFEVDLAGNFRVVYNLNNPGNAGGGPVTTLIQASDGNLWGTGGQEPFATLYALSIAGTLSQSITTTCAQTDTQEVTDPLIQATDGKLYGVGMPGSCSATAGLTAFTAGTIFTINAGLPPLPNPKIAAVTNGASFAAGSLVPGEIATAFGTSLTTSTGINLSSSLPLPGSLLGSEVLVNGCAATPLFAVDNVNGQQQINFQAPWEIAGQQVVAVQVVNNGGISPPVDVPVLAAQPGIIAILHADYSAATTASPVTAGETVLIYGTGLGAVSTAQVDGTAANGESTIALPEVTVGGTPAMVAFSGLAPGFVGLNQVNIVVPSGLASGNQAVGMNVGGVASNSVLLPVH